jgi:hypothetical protein
MTIGDPSLAAARPTPLTGPAHAREEPWRAIFHRLNNQLGIVLANAELLESRATDATGKARATQIIDSALQAMAVVREIRLRLEPDA